MLVVEVALVLKAVADLGFVDGGGGGPKNFFFRKLLATQYRQLDKKPFLTCYILPFSIFPFTRLFKIQEAAFKIQLGLLISI